MIYQEHQIESVIYQEYQIESVIYQEHQTGSVIYQEHQTVIDIIFCDEFMVTDLYGMAEHLHA